MTNINPTRLSLCVSLIAVGLAVGCSDDPATPDPLDTVDAITDSASDAEADQADALEATDDPLTDVPSDTNIESDTDDVLGDSDVELDALDREDSADGFDGRDAEPTYWRSSLYPEDWEPGFEGIEGRYLHDFSYAGYRYGETPLAQGVSEAIIDVVTAHSADPTGAQDSTIAVQAAIDAAEAAGGGVVYFPEGLYRFDGRLYIGASRVVLRGAGAALSRLYFTSSAGMAYQSHISFRGSLTSDLELALTADAATWAFTVEVSDAGDLAAGDDVVIGWVITPEFVEEHQMTGVWRAFNDTWQPFFRREVVSVDRSSSPHLVELDVPLRYPALVRDSATIRREHGYLSECGFESLGVANAVAWSDAWSIYSAHVLEMSGVEDSWIRDIASFSPPSAPTEGRGVGDHLQSSGLVIRSSKRVTVADSTLERAQNRGSGGCGYLYEVRQSSEILFRDLIGRDGRHNFIQNWGFGVTGCVWIRVTSSGGSAYVSSSNDLYSVGKSEFHHSLATANLIDSCTFDDGWGAINRKDESTGAGHTATENVLWNTGGTGTISSFQYGWGYVIGTEPSVEIEALKTEAPVGLEDLWELLAPWTATEPMDFVEGEGRAEWLVPASLYEDQLTRRLDR